MDSSSFHKMDMKKYKNILNNLKKNSEIIKKNNIEEEMDFYENKYQELISKYSEAYLHGSYWYLGKSFKGYIKEKNLNNLLDYKLEYVRYILKINK